MLQMRLDQSTRADPKTRQISWNSEPRRPDSTNENRLTTVTIKQVNRRLLDPLEKMLLLLLYIRIVSSVIWWHVTNIKARSVFKNIKIWQQIADELKPERWRAMLRATALLSTKLSQKRPETFFFSPSSKPQVKTLYSSPLNDTS